MLNRVRAVKKKEVESSSCSKKNSHKIRTKRPNGTREQSGNNNKIRIKREITAIHHAFEASFMA